MFNLLVLEPLQSLLKDPRHCISVSTGKSQTVFVIGLEEKEDEAFIRQFGDHFRYKLLADFGCPIAVAVSRGYRDYRNICEGYREVVELMSYRFLLGSDRTITSQTHSCSCSSDRPKVAIQVLEAPRRSAAGQIHKPPR